LLSGEKSGVGRAMTASVVLAVTLIVLVIGAWRVSRLDRGLCALAALCYAGGVVLLAYEPNPRYLLPILPLLFWFAVAGMKAIGSFFTTKQFSGHAIAGWPLGVTVTILAATLLGANLIKAQREIVMARSKDFYAVYDRGRWKPYVEVAQWLRAHAAPDARLVTSEEPSLAYLTGHPWQSDAQQAKAGDFLILEPRATEAPRTSGKRNVGRDMIHERERVAWRLVDAGAAEEVFRSGNLTVYRLRSGAVSVQ
jgi:hypothetical protein